MSFLLYTVKTKGASRRFGLLHEDYESSKVALAGQTGPLATYVRETYDRNQGDAWGWHLSEAQLLRHWGHAPGRQAIVIDLKPKRPDVVSLYRLCDVWGLSYPEWTPIALRLEVLYEDEACQNALAFKSRFATPAQPGTLVHEFLYLNGGTASGGWGFGVNGYSNGALLYPDAWTFFVQELSKARV